MASSTITPVPSVMALFIGAKISKPLEPVDQVTAVAGHGLEGDRKYRRAGLPADKDGPDRELTLIEAEAIESASREYGVAIEPIETRRNVLTRGVALNHLVGKRFKVGEVVLQGIRLCEPCDHLEARSLAPACGRVHRGGLRAQILEGGPIRVGDAISLVG